MTIACVSGCSQRDRHLTECPCSDPHHEHAEPTTATYQGPLEDAPGWSCHWCSGCLPRPAVLGLAVCAGCERAVQDGLAELPDLWVDLAERPRLAGLSKAPISEGETPDPMSDARRQERSAIKAMLVSWCLTLADDYSVTIPDEAAIAATTRRLAAWHSDQARQARNAANLLDMPTLGPLHRDQVGAAAMRRQAAESAEQARAVRDDRETGRDVLRAICEHITRHVDALLSGEHAEQLVADLKAAMKARGLAYPTAPDGKVLIPCPACGERSEAKSDTQNDIACPHCGAKGDTAWWGGVAQREPMGFVHLRAFLANHGLHTTVRQLRSWADKQILVSTRPSRGEDGKMQERLFDPYRSVDVVTRMLSKRRHERSVA